VGKARDWTDQYTLLCEGCGYPLETIPREGACPECGRSIKSSLPSTRTGSAWQRRSGIGSWFATAGRVIARPKGFFETIRVEPRSSRGLATVNLLLCGLIVASLPTARLLMGNHWMVPWAPKADVFFGRSYVWWTLAVTFGTWATVSGVLWLLTWIETLGVKFFHGRRGWRVTEEIAWSVCAHATYGWVLSALLIVLGWGLIDLDIAVSRAVRTTRVGSRLGDWQALPPAIGFFIGMMVFEFRVYQGMRVCRFANTGRVSNRSPVARATG
jgi:hypothetical protein